MTTAAPQDPQPNPWPRRTAIGVTSIVPAAIDMSHDLAKGATISVPCVVFNIAGVLVTLVGLTTAFDACRRRRLASGPSFSVIAGLGVALYVAELGFVFAVHRATGFDLLGGSIAHMTSVARVCVFIAGESLWSLGLWAVAVVFPFAIRDANVRAREADRLRTAAELARLRAHLQPHFLLNTLNTVSGLVSQDPEEARRLVGALGDLLRDSVEEGDEMQTLEAEVSWLQRYAEILETRHRGALTFRWDIDDGTRAVKVPRLLLQPLLENAVKHGARRRRGGGEVIVTARVDDASSPRVRCVVEDNGPGPGERGARPGAMGIQLVTRRLALKYAGAASFRLEASDGRTRSIVEIPMEAP
ncbi:MAG TPA: histidine kinase [Polyangiaceae bacterium]